MSRVAVATTSRLAADAAREIADLGGNAVDCALAAALVSMNTEPGICALSGGAYVSIWAPGESPVTIDGNVAIPGIAARIPVSAASIEKVALEYGGGVTTLVGAGSVGVPGAPAAAARAAERYGVLPWATVLGPAIRAARDGFPLPAACHYYLQYSGNAIFGRSTDGRTALHDDNGKLQRTGSTIRVPHLADTLELLARKGVDSFYRGEIAAAICRHVEDHGGRLTAADLEAYRPVERPALRVAMGDWSIATNPPPAIGGAVLAAMLTTFAQTPVIAWDTKSVGRLIDVQSACLSYRRDRLDLAENLDDAIAGLLAAAVDGRLVSASASTVHTSAVDAGGLACAITASSGYGSGEMPAGTGLWLNNCLGEIELNRRGPDAGPPGARLPSNMAPTVARNRDRVLAVGSPGADRITTAIHQFLVNFLQLGLSVDAAVAAPRLHVVVGAERASLRAEPGLPLPATKLPVQVADALNMYFGGVGAACYDPELGFEVAADPRREGGTCEA